MLLHLRVTVPADRTDAGARAVRRHAGVAHLARLPGAVGARPSGDLVLADVARESADGLVEALQELGIDRDGGIAIGAVDAAVSTRGRAPRSARRATGPTPSSGSRSCGPPAPSPRCRSPTSPSSRSRRCWPRSRSSTTRRSCVIGAMVLGPGVRPAGRPGRGARAPPAPSIARRATVVAGRRLRGGDRGDRPRRASCGRALGWFGTEDCSPPTGRRPGSSPLPTAGRSWWPCSRGSPGCSR